MIVSVPYWGSLSSNFVNDVPKTLKDFKFPSPTGVLYLLISVIDTLYLTIKFPSPTGVLYLLIAEKKLSSHSDELEFPSPTGVLYLLIE